MSGDESRVLADEQAALRRVATLVARATPPAQVFGAVAEEAGRLLAVDFAILVRYDPGDMLEVVGAWTRTGAPPPTSVGGRLPLGGRNVTTVVYRTGQSARIDYSDVSGVIGEVASRDWGLRSSVGVPVSAESRLWGCVVVAFAGQGLLPAGTEARLASFTELLATAIASTQARMELRGFADEQAALRRVATLVARGAVPEEVFAAVTEEVGQLFPVDLATMCRYNSDRTLTFVASWGSVGRRFPVGSQGVLGGHNIGTRVFETGRPVRIDGYAERASGVQGARVRAAGVRSAVGTPIIVEGRLWGVISAASSLEQPLPPDTEERLASFTELVATAIANAESRAGLARLAEEQAALRRVAVLVARGVPPEEVFAAVAEEVGQLLPVDSAALCRYEPDGALTFVSQWGSSAGRFPVGSRWALGGHNLGTLVFQTGRPARVDGYAESSSGALGTGIREVGLRSAIGTPIIVEGRLWGLIPVASQREQPLPPDIEGRLVSFTELVATAIANAESRAALAASRSRIAAAADETRRRIERDLHDGTQQQLVSLILKLRIAQTALPSQLGDLRVQLSHIAGELSGVFERVREISHGIHPAILSERGLESALKALARRSAVPVELDLRAGRLPEPVEVAAYYAVSEALANAAKHAHASAVHVELDTPDALMRLAIRDDGIGGADPAQGSGLVGLRDRIEAVGGTLEVTSPAGGGTTLLIEIPV